VITGSKRAGIAGGPLHRDLDNWTHEGGAPEIEG
jgi:hypothetical protein